MLDIGEENPFGGSAVLISDDVALTATHNVYSHESDVKWKRGIDFYPGSDDGSNGQQLGVWSADYFYVPDGWINNQDWEQDYAYVRLASQDGRKVGNVTNHYFGVGIHPEINSLWTVVGYPSIGGTAKEMFVTQRYGHDDGADGEPFFVKTRLAHGMSGGPWIPDLNLDDPRSYYVFGLTSYTTNDGRLFSPYLDERFSDFTKAFSESLNSQFIS